MSLRLVARQPPALPVDASSLAPGALAALPLADIERLRLPHGRDTIAVAELFEVHSADDATRDTLVLDGDLSRFDSIGAGLAGGTIEVHGPVGDSAGLGMSAGRLVIHGRARDLTGCAMRGGWLEVMGDIGDFGACARPGDMNGMRGGTLLVRGAAGARLGDRMRRGTVLVWGDCGDFVASRMVAGTLVAGRPLRRARGVGHAARHAAVRGRGAAAAADLRAGALRRRGDLAAAVARAVALRRAVRRPAAAARAAACRRPRRGRHRRVARVALGCWP